MGIGIVLIIVGIAFLAGTLYQVSVEEELRPEDYHMAPQPAKYEWRSHNPVITLLGLVAIPAGFSVSLLGAKKKQ